MKHLTIGLGEVGKALKEILKCDGLDSDQIVHGEYDMIHICFPYSSKFNDFVEDYQESFKPKYTVIHSTVPIGTSKKLGACHSPIRGKHPDLKKSILTFEKYIGGKYSVEVSKELGKYNIPCIVIANSDDTEAGKLFSLMQFGMSILINKEIHAYCKKHNLNFFVAYQDFNNTYNDGYKKMGMPEVTRPILKYMEGEIGGHCVSQMMELLDTKSAKEIIKHKPKEAA